MDGASPPSEPEPRSRSSRRRRGRSSKPPAAQDANAEAQPAEVETAQDAEAPAKPARKRAPQSIPAEVSGQEQSEAVEQAPAAPEPARAPRRSQRKPRGEQSAEAAAQPPAEEPPPAPTEEGPPPARRRGRRSSSRRAQGANTEQAGAEEAPSTAADGNAPTGQGLGPDREGQSTGPQPRPRRSARSRRGEARGEQAGERLNLAPAERIEVAHPSEREFARILDYYGLAWDYEPRSFPLRWEGDHIYEMFTPDFYLKDLDLYVEMTTLKQGLVTQKNRKLRRIRELYPEINIKLLYRRDFYRLLAKFGVGPLAEVEVRGIDRVLFNTNQIQDRVTDLAYRISEDYEGRRPVLVGVLRGVMCFMADLMRDISLPVAVEFMAVSPFAGGSRPGVRITKDLDGDISGEHVILVEDIVDTGMTLNYLVQYLRSRGPASLEVCTLLDKRVRRIVEAPLKYVGFEIPDEFVVGYGLDYMELYRNLPFIGVLNPEARAHLPSQESEEG